MMIAYPYLNVDLSFVSPPYPPRQAMASVSGGDGGGGGGGDGGDGGGGRPQRQRRPSAKARDMEGIDLNRIIESLSKGACVHGGMHARACISCLCVCLSVCTHVYLCLDTDGR